MRKEKIPLVSVYRNSNDTKGAIVSLTAVKERILDGKRGLARKTKECNALALTDPKAYRKFKEGLPCVTFGGQFKYRNSRPENLIEHSGHLVIDIDNIDIGSTLADLSLRSDYTFAFVSPSGAGIKIIVALDPVPQSPIEHKAAFLQVSENFSDLDCIIDPTGSDVSRLCYLAHDPKALIPENPESVEWDIEAVAELEAKVETSEKSEWHGEVDISALKYIPNDCDYETWRNVGMAIKTAGLPLSIFQEWTNGQRKRSTGEWVAEDIAAHWGRYNGVGITWGTVVHLALENGWTPPPKSTKAQFNAQFKPQTTELEKERNQIHSHLKDWLDRTAESEKEILNITTAAGTGKSTTCILNIDELLYIAKTREEADQAFTLAEDETAADPTAFRDTYRHRPRAHNLYDSDNNERPEWYKLRHGLGEDERPCIHPQDCETLATAGHPPKIRCDYCHAQEDCGYLKQTDIEAMATHVFYAWKRSCLF